MSSTKGEHVSNNSKNNGKPYGQVVITLKNQLLPDEKLSPTPSQIDGLGIDTETDLRIYGCELIQTAGILLKLPQVAMATGQVLLQRFYYSKSLVRHPVDHTAMACVCLASKIEEAPRRVRDVINVFTHIRQVNSNKSGPARRRWASHYPSALPSQQLIERQNFSALIGYTELAPESPLRASFGPRQRYLASRRPIQPVILDQNYIHLKNLVIKAERRVLKELGFCVHIKHPHKIIVMYLQVLGFQSNQKLMQYSWNYMNDSLRTDVFVRYQPETVACACIYLTARKLKLPLPRNPYWYTIFGATETEIRDICIRILKLYNRPKGNIDALEKKVEELCKKYQDARAKARGSSGNNTPNNNDSSPSQQKTTGAHNAWGGFISRSGSHIAPPVSDKRSRSRSMTHSPESKHRKRSKKHRSRSRSTSRNHKKGHKRKSYSRSRSNSPHSKSRKREKRRSRSPSNDRELKNDRYVDKYDKYEKIDKYEKDRYKDDRDRDRYSEKDRYDDKKDRKDKYEKEDKYKDREEKYSRDERERYKKSKHRDEESRSKDRRR